MSLSGWVFKWRLKVRMLSHSRMSAGREFQVDSNRKSAMGQFGVYARNDEHRSIGRARSPRWCMSLYTSSLEIRWSGRCGPQLRTL